MLVVNSGIGCLNFTVGRFSNKLSWLYLIMIINTPAICQLEVPFAEMMQKEKLDLQTTHWCQRLEVEGVGVSLVVAVSDSSQVS